MSQPKRLTRRCDVVHQAKRDRRAEVDRTSAAMPPKSIGNCSNAVSFPTLSPIRRRLTTFSTATFLSGFSVEDAAELRKADQVEYERERWIRWRRHVEAMLEFQTRGSVVFDYGNNLRQRAIDNGVENAFDYPGLCSGVHSPAVLRRQRPVSLGRALRRQGRHLQNRRSDNEPLPRKRPSRALADDGAGTGRVSGPARAYLLARLRRTCKGRSEIK